MFSQDQRDTEFVEELMNVLGDEVKEVESFVIVYKYKDRFTSPFARTLRWITHNTLNTLVGQSGSSIFSSHDKDQFEASLLVTRQVLTNLILGSFFMSKVSESLDPSKKI